MSVREIACDESGAEGERLIGGNTDVFAHASVSLSPAAAAECMREIRRRAPSPTVEYKAGILLRDKHRAALAWLLGPGSPLPGNAHVVLVDKTFFAVGKVVQLLLGEVRQAEAIALHREGPARFGGARWAAFLDAFNTLMRARTDAEASAESYASAVRALPREDLDGEAGEVVALLRRTGADAAGLRARLLGGQAVAVPPLDPLIPALVRTIEHWSRDGEPVTVVHDRQTTLTEERVALLAEMLPRPQRLAGLRLVHSLSDARVQVADVLAGAARKIASDDLNGRGDRELVALLRPYVDPASVWGDERWLRRP
ncbi:hypothetical protein [Thermoactinospora rubra]|uniref:hypothetical protein n=1 Tax=Thermoactinospora rubra TaxID=1088767 RepID=UPI000A0F6C22|nr:hypothetical protein [Thermoactinospora rubra]